VIPVAVFAHNWPEAGGDFFNTHDPDNRLYMHQATISRKSAEALGYRLVWSEDELQDLIRMENAALIGIREMEARP
jgi:hypothetical protein